MADKLPEDERKKLLAEIMDRGERAKVIWAEIEEVFKALEADALKTFRKSDLHDTEGLRAARYYLRVLDDVKQRFDLAVHRGKIADHKLERMTGADDDG